MSTKYVGTAGSVQVPDTLIIAGIKSWVLDVTSDTVETTSFDDLGVRAHLGTVIGWSGSFEGYKTMVPLVIDGSVESICKFSETPGAYWLGTIILTGLTSNTSHDGLVTYNYTFLGTGELVEPTG